MQFKEKNSWARRASESKENKIGIWSWQSCPSAFPYHLDTEEACSLICFQSSCLPRGGWSEAASDELEVRGWFPRSNSLRHEWDIQFPSYSSPTAHCAEGTESISLNHSLSNCSLVYWHVHQGWFGNLSSLSELWVDNMRPHCVLCRSLIRQQLQEWGKGASVTLRQPSS